MDSRAAEGGVDAGNEVRNVIRLQLGAFRKNDFKTAYSFAHSGIKEQITAPQFEQMVRDGFSEMLEPGVVAFAEVREDGVNALVEVTLTDADGSRTSYQYVLEKENGEWRIAAVIPIEIAERLV